MTQATNIVTVKAFMPMIREVENEIQEASNIQVVTFEENGFEVVAMKGLYSIGDKIILISPDYCLPDTELFKPYTAPEGNPKKSRLGGYNRVRAIKFNFYKEDGQKVYSNGILMPMQEVKDYLVKQKSLLLCQSVEDIAEHLDDYLGIHKVEKEVVDNESLDGLPEGVYKTDETNINNIKRATEASFPCEYIGTLKIDGSSCLEQNTIIETSIGNKVIKNIVVGDFVKSFDHNINLECFKKVLATKKTKNKTGWFKITLEEGVEIVATENHLFFLPELNCYRKLSELKEGDVFQILD